MPLVSVCHPSVDDSSASRMISFGEVSKCLSSRIFSSQALSLFARISVARREALERHFLVSHRITTTRGSQTTISVKPFCFSLANVNATATTNPRPPAPLYSIEHLQGLAPHHSHAPSSSTERSHDEGLT